MAFVQALVLWALAERLVVEDWQHWRHRHRLPELLVGGAASWAQRVAEKAGKLLSVLVVVQEGHAMVL